jgi:uncharacterized DUF497 family protein
VYDIDWKDKAVEHIARHHVEMYEVEEGINDDDPKITKRRKDRQIILCQTAAGRYLVILLSYPPVSDQVRVITARDMTQREKA